MGVNKSILSDKFIVTDLTKINPGIICSNHRMSKKELKTAEFILTCDGKIYINRKGLFKDVLVAAFNIISVASQYDLDQLRKKYKMMFPNVKTAEDIEKVDYDLRFEALIYLFIPVELERRTLEKTYYGCK